MDQAGLWAEALRQRRPVILNDYGSHPKKKGLPQGHVDITNDMVIPIIRNEKIKAVLGIGNKPEGYTQQDMQAAVRFADHAWDIVERKNMELAIADERNQLAKRVEERTIDLSRANSNLARALRVKDEFLANMSHELRTPLNAILGLSESLAEQTAGPLNEKQSRYISTISESGHHLLSLINDILDLAKIDAGQITLNINKVDIRSICEDSLRMVKQLASKKNQAIELDVDQSIGLKRADERRLKQMMVNHLSKPYKFTSENGKLGLEVRGKQPENQHSYTV
jgi:signal transduction histidine kinase